MIKRRATAGLSLLCALMFCAFAAQSASAQVGTPSKNTTAVTCVSGGGNLDFSDAHCDNKVTAGTGQYGHVAISNGTKTEIEVTNKETANSTIDHTPAFLNTISGGVAAEIECTTVTSANSYIENSESGSEHKVKGTVEVKFSNCKGIKPAACKEIKEPIVTIAEFRGVEGLKAEGGLTETMGVEFFEEPGKNFTEITFGKEATCAFKEKTFPVTGTAIATGTPAPTKANKHSGATSVYVPNKTTTAGIDDKPAEEMETLKFGGNRAHFKGTFTTRMVEKAGVKQNPIALTTTT
jgi:hypothetical protein